MSHLPEGLVPVERCPNCSAAHQAWRGVFDAEFISSRGTHAITDLPGVLCAACKNFLLDRELVARLERVTGSDLRCLRAIASDRYLERPQAA